MGYLVDFGVVLVIVYLIYLVFIVLRKKGRENIKKGQYALMLSRTFKVDMKKLSNTYVSQLIAIANSIIIATTVVAINLVDEFIFKILLAFATLTLLQIVVYYILSKIMKRRIKHV